MAATQATNTTSPPSYDDAVPPRLTRMEMIGFKSFASKTAFQFEKGITAVVGPNGSGKSNIADAVRWALGETSYSSLRSKKTEDVIFAGGSGKAPAGMAEVTLTFDNSTGWLPIDFTEVTVTRRAFRSGETAYLINGRKVRLKDVHQLTAGLGQSYTVVGQGLVDAALSQRSEDRRGMFEHAADLTGLRLKAAEAERNLNETEANSARLNDLLTEVEPRLRQLERAAKQANEYRDVRDRLRLLQRFHFRGLLSKAQAKLESVEASAALGISSADALQAGYDELLATSTTLRSDREQIGDILEQQRAGLFATTEQLRRVSHEREIASERLASLEKRREDMGETQATLNAQITGVLADLEDVRQQVAQAQETAAAARKQLEEAEAALVAERASRAHVEKEHSRLLAVATDRERQIADASRRKALILQRTETDQAERSRTEQASKERADRLQRLAADLTALDQSEETSGYRLTSIDAGVIEIVTAINAANAESALARERVQVLERELADASARLRELRRIHETGAGLFAGVRAVVQAGRQKTLSGIRGTLAELITLPVAYDTAMEVALGGHLQDIVVENWSQAEAAITFLKKQNAGRATFQPIDTVRGRKPNADAVRDVAGLKGVHGVACELLTVSAELEGIINALLGRSLIVDDLDTARACLPHMPSGWSAITLTGEIVRTAGSVTGGAQVRESGALGRERELRELPDEITQIEAKLTKARAAAETAAAKPRALVEDRQQLESERSAILATRREREQQRARIATWLEETRREDERAQSRTSALDQDRSAAESTLTDIDGELERLTRERDVARAELEAASVSLNRDSDTSSATELGYREAQRLVAGNDERLNAERRRESTLTAQQSTLQQEQAVRAERAAAVDGEITAIRAQVDRLAAEVLKLTAEQESAQTELAPLEEKYSTLVSGLADIEAHLESARAALLEAERTRGTAGMDVERVRGEVGALHQRIQDELDLDEPTSILEADDETDEGEVPDDPAETEREINRLKDRLRRVGYAGDNAVEDYERERERYTFLREQLDDVEGAAASIRTMLDEVRSTMQERFEETFQRVSIIFSQMFSTLFGGGTARLVMVDR